MDANPRPAAEVGRPGPAPAAPAVDDDGYSSEDDAGPAPLARAAPAPAPMPRTGAKRVRFQDEEAERLLEKRAKTTDRVLEEMLGPRRRQRAVDAEYEVREKLGDTPVDFDDGSEFFSGPLPPVQDKTNRVIEHTPVPHPLVPQPPFTWNVIGPSGQGKTTALVRLMKGPLKDRFDRVFFFVPSFYTDDAWAHIRHPNARVFTSWSPDDFKEIHRYQQELCRRERLGDAKAPDVLIVIDDSMGFQHSGPRITALDELYSYGRKARISVVNLCQRFKGQLSATARRNATCTSVFDLHNSGEYNAVREELSRPGVTRHQFDAMYKEATSREKGGFLHIDRLNRHGAPYTSGLSRVFPAE